MIGYSRVLRADGSATESVRHDEPMDLDFMQAAVGGEVQLVPYFEWLVRDEPWLPCIAFCHAEGKLLKLPHNAEATRMWQAQVVGPLNDWLAGDVLIVFGDTEFLNAL